MTWLIHIYYITHWCFDWCCFYHFVRNSLVAWLEDLCAQVFFIREYRLISDIFVFVTWLIDVCDCDMTHWCMWHTLFIYLTRVMHTCDMTHVYMWHDWFIHLHVSFMHVTWPIYAHEITHSGSLSLSLSISLSLTHTHRYTHTHAHTRTHTYTPIQMCHMTDP